MLLGRSFGSAPALLFVLPVLAACAASPHEEEAATDDAALVSVLADSAEVGPDRIVFPHDSVPSELRERIVRFRAAIDAGQRREDIENVILIGDRAKNAVDASGRLREDVGNPYGYIRRALSIRDAGARTIIETEPATLEEAFSEIEARGIIGLGPASPIQGFRRDTTLHHTLPILQLDGQEIFREGDSVVRIQRGYVGLDTKIDLGIDVSRFRVQHVHMNLDARLDSELTLDVVAAGRATFSPERSVYRGRWPVGTIGPIPVTLALDTVIGCDIEATGRVQATTGVKATLSAKGGVTYERDRGVQPSAERPVFTPTVLPVTVDASGNASAKCRLEPQLALLLFDAAGPTFTPSLNARVEAKVPPLRATVYGGVSGSIGGTLKVFGRELGSVEAELFDVERELWRTPAN